MKLAALCKLLALSVMALGACGCASSYRAPPTAPQKDHARFEPEPEVTRFANLYLLGFFGSVRTDVRDVCKSGMAERISVRTTWLTSLTTVATLGLYSPLELGVVCAPEIPDAEFSR